ncbi:MAG: ABC transporter permease [Anaerolineaceae bacterium]|nr:ABC transporter permease [Anaerolineaceae bacterium]
MLLRTWSLIRKEFIHVSRDPRTLAVMIIMPLMQLILLGFAGTTDVKHLRTAVYDADHSPQSRALIEAYQASDYFDIIAYTDNEAELGHLIDHGDVRGALIIPAGYGRDITAQKRTDVAFLIDGSDPTIANTVYGSSQQVGQAVSSGLIEQRLGVSVNNLPGVEVRPRVWYNPDMKSANFIIPGLMALVLFLYTSLFTASSIVRERELGTIEQLIVTPIRPLELIVAKVIPYILISFFILIEILVIGVLLFQVPIHGSIVLLMQLAGLFLITALGIGIFISSVANSQQEALLMTQAIMLPSIFLSGLFFPIDAMPRWLQFISYLFPVRYAVTIIRGIVLKGVGINNLTEQVVAVLIFGALIVLLASTRFKKKLD